MNVEHIKGRNRFAAARPTVPKQWGCRLVRGFILVAIAAALHANPVQAQKQNGVVLAQTTGFFVEAQAVSEDLDLPDLRENLAVESTTWGYKRYSQPDNVCLGNLIVGDSIHQNHPKCPWTGASSDPANVSNRYASNHGFGVQALADISAQITNMDENLFRVAGRYQTFVKVEPPPEYKGSASSKVSWSILLTIKRPMKVIVSNCELFDTRFLPIQYARDEGGGHWTCAFEIRDVDKYNVAGPTPEVAGQEPAAGMSEEEWLELMGLDKEEFEKLKSTMAEMGHDMGVLGAGQPDDKLWAEPSPEIVKAAQSPILSREETWQKLQELPPLDIEWIPSDYIEHQIGAQQHEAYEKRRAGDPEALAEQQEFLDWLTVFNESISGRQLMFALNDDSFVTVGFMAAALQESDNPNINAEESERFTISLYPIADINE